MIKPIQRERGEGKASERVGHGRQVGARAASAHVSSCFPFINRDGDPAYIVKLCHLNLAIHVHF